MLLSAYLEEQAKTIVRAGQNLGVLIRSMGSTAVRIHCPKFRELLGGEPADFNFMVRGRHIDEIAQLFRDSGYEEDPRTRQFLLFHGRALFRHPATKLLAEIFFDELSMWHTIDFKERLKLDSPTITLADLVLEKAQMVKIGEDDLKDLAVLFLEHDLGESDREKIDDRYIRELLAKDWGFYYTVTTNLKKVKDRLAAYDALDSSQREQTASRIDRLLASIENEPKSASWRMRASIGPRRIWYNEIE
jgi:hypothetical protein